jgi:hypothetical protein
MFFTIAHKSLIVGKSGEMTRQYRSRRCFPPSKAALLRRVTGGVVFMEHPAKRAIDVVQGVNEPEIVQIVTVTRADI